MKKRICRVLVLVLAIGACRFAMTLPQEAETAYATEDQISKLKDQISDSKSERDALNAQKSDLVKIRNQLKQSKEDMNNYIYQVDSQIGTIQGKINDLGAQAEVKRGQIANVEEELESAQRVQELQYEQMKERIKFMYERGNYMTFDVLAGAGDFADMLNKAQYVVQLAEYDRMKLQEYMSTVAMVELTKEALEEEKLTLEETILQQEQEEANLQALMNEKQNEIYGLNEDIATQEEKIKQYEAQIAAANAEIAAMESELSKLQVNYTYNGEPFIWPCPQATVLTSPFGMRLHPIYKVNKLHSGVDMAAPGGSPILAAADGYVLRAGWQSSMGNYVMLAHSDSLVTVYMHASALYVKAGDTVTAGTTIAAVGSTGDSTGNHLHFSVRVNGQYVEPLNYLPTWTGRKNF